jgi:hypothetical protein
MHGTKKLVIAALVICMIAVSVGSVAAAMNGNQKGDLDRQQLKDGSCNDCAVPIADQQKDMLQEQAKLQLKDGSCNDCPCLI